MTKYSKSVYFIFGVMPHLCVGLWVIFLAAMIFEHSSNSIQVPIYDAATYFVKAYNFWNGIYQHQFANPLDIEPVVRPPGTILVSYPFGFSNNPQWFYFRTVFIPLVLLIVSIYLVIDHDDICRRGWIVMAIVFLFSSMPLFFSFEPNESVSGDTYWGLVDNFQASLAALATSVMVRSFRRRSVSWLLAGSGVAAISLMVKPSGAMVMALLGLGWIIILAGEILSQWKIAGTLSQDLKRYAINGVIGSLIIYVLFVGIAVNSKYLSAENFMFAKKVLNTMRNSGIQYDMFLNFHRMVGEIASAVIIIGFIWYVIISISMRQQLLGCINSLCIPVSAILTWGFGCYYWIFVQEGASNIRYFYPFFLMGLISLVPSFLILSKALSVNIRRLAFVICIMPAINIAALLVAANPSVSWQEASGVNVIAGKYRTERDDAYRFIKTIKNNTRPVVYFFGINSMNLVSFSSVGEYESIIHPEMPSFQSRHSIDWVRGLAVRLDEVGNSDYIVLRQYNQDKIDSLLMVNKVSTYQLEIEVAEAWILSHASQSGLLRVPDLQVVPVYKVIDRNAFRDSLLEMAHSRTWRPVFMESVSKLQSGMISYVMNIVLGDRFGTVSPYADHVIFVHPGQTTPTTFDFNAGKYTRGALNKTIHIDAHMHPNIPPDVVAAGGGIAHLVVRIDEQLIVDTMVSVGHPFAANLNPSKDGLIHIMVDNAGISNSNWLLLSFTSQD